MTNQTDPSTTLSGLVPARADIEDAVVAANRNIAPAPASPDDVSGYSFGAVFTPVTGTALTVFCRPPDPPSLHGRLPDSAFDGTRR
jgi:hypothetical protein